MQEGGGSKADSIRPVLKLMQLIGALSGNKSVPQVALGYLKAKGAPACAHSYTRSALCLSVGVPGATSCPHVRLHALFSTPC